MSRLRRRSFLATGVAAVLGGCAGGGRRREELLDGTYRVGAESYLSWEFELEQEAELAYSFSVAKDAVVDFYVLTRDLLRTFEQQGGFRLGRSWDAYLDDSTAGGGSVVLSPGEYAILVAEPRGTDPDTGESLGVLVVDVRAVLRR